MNELKKGLSICLFAHNEGNFLIDSYRSIMKNLKNLEYLKKKIDFEIVVIIDSPNNQTCEVALELEKLGTLLKKVENKDLGLNRNYAAKIARFDKIAFIDGDDIWDKNWLAQCLSKLGKGYQVLHPETVIYCGERNEIAICKSSNRFTSKKRIEIENLWVSSIFTYTKIILENRFYAKAELDSSHFEDWNWNKRTLKKGVSHKVVRKSYIYVHTRKNSLSQNLIREMKNT